MKPSIRMFAFAAALSLPSIGTSQVVFGEIGFSLVDAQGNSAGDPCWGFSCTPHHIALQEGRTATSVVRAPLNGLYVVFASLTANSCAVIPNAHNSLVLDTAPVIAPLFAGVVSEQNFLRWCYDGLQQDSLPIPIGLLGATFALQAVAEVPTPSRAQWAWSSAIIVTIV